MSGLSGGHDVMYIATKILHLGYLFDQAQDMRCIVLPAADCSHVVAGAAARVHVIAARYTSI